MVAGRERIANEQVSGVSIEVGKYSVYWTKVFGSCPQNCISELQNLGS
jgi:hypothetical protein